MHTPCNCSRTSASVEPFTADVTSFPFSHVENLTKSGMLALASAAPRAKADSALQQIHTTADGGLFATTASATDQEGHVDLRGTLGPFPVELSLTINLKADEILVTLEVTKPIHLGPFTWHFKFGGLARDAKGNLTGADTIALSPDTPAFDASAAFGGHFLCFLKCAGLTILPILLACLPSLAGGPPAFIACVVGKAGQGAAGIAACVAKCATA